MDPAGGELQEHRSGCETASGKQTAEGEGSGERCGGWEGADHHYSRASVGADLHTGRQGKDGVIHHPVCHSWVEN